MSPAIELHREGRLLRGHPVLSGTLGAELAHEERDRACGAFRRAAAGSALGALDLNNSTAVGAALARLAGRIYALERPHRPSLVRLAVETAAAANGLEAGFVESTLARAELVEPFSLGCVACDMPEAPSPRGVARALFARRLTHNALIHGESLVHFTEGPALARAELDRLNAALMPNCSMFANLAMAGHFLAAEPVGWPRAGISRIIWTGGEARLEARATNFPILVQELSKGLQELCWIGGLGAPGEFDAVERDAIRLADAECFEGFLFQTGPSLARRLNKALRDFELVHRYGQRPDPGLDDGFTRALLARLPGKELHSVLPGLVSRRATLRVPAARRLAKLLDELERA